MAELTESDVIKGGYVVVSSFRCIHDFKKTYHEGQKISGFAPERIEKLLKLGYIKRSAGRPPKVGDQNVEESDKSESVDTKEVKPKARGKKSDK